MAIFARGYIWPDAPGTITPLTAAYVPSTLEFEVHEQSRLFCIATLPIGGVPDPGLQVRLDVSFDWGVTWYPGYKIRSIPAFAVGTHGFFIDLPTNWHAATWRIAARDMRGNADTTTRIYAHSMIRGADAVNNDVPLDPIELASAMIAGELAFHDGAGAAVALNLGMALGPPAPADPWWVPVGRANEVEIWATTTGGPPTSVEMLIEESPDDGATLATLPVVNFVAAGNANLWPGHIQLQSGAGTLANDTYVSHRIPVNPGSWIRMQAQRTGVAVNLLARFRLYRNET